MRKLTCDPQSETLGQNLRALSDNLQGEKPRSIMDKYGILDAKRDEWYPTKLVMDSLNELSQNAGAMFNLVDIGMIIGETIPVAAGYANPTLEQALMDWDNVYQAVHRNGDAGTIYVEKINDSHFEVTFTDLYPDDFSYGIMYSYGQRFLPPGTNFTVAYDTGVTSRDMGGQGATVIHIYW